MIAAIVIILLFFGKFFGKEIFELTFETVIGYCPPLLIFILAAAFIADRNCLANLGGGCLILVGIVAFVAWLIWKFG